MEYWRRRIQKIFGHMKMYALETVEWVKKFLFTELQFSWKIQN